MRSVLADAIKSFIVVLDIVSYTEWQNSYWAAYTRPQQAPSVQNASQQHSPTDFVVSVRVEMMDF